MSTPQLHRPAIVGILNLTEDSFSDGGQYLDRERARQQAQFLRDSGAHWLDVGPASSHPDAGSVSPQQELQRLQAVWPGLDAAHTSIDSWQRSTQEWALAQGAGMLNDIHGFPDPGMYARLADSDALLVVMHALQAKGMGKADRRRMEPEQVWQHLLDFFDARLAALMQAGIARHRLILDPGMGFFLGSNPDASWLVLQRLPVLRQRYDLPLYVSVSRKSFLGRLTGRDVDQRAAATLAAELLVADSVDYIRTHDAAALADALQVRIKIKTQ